ncbi:hypothetical protein F7734_30575 [Scytonema sp. UIC 10036]|uniref:hypothetical protein n=1 Tax=Scytonema sp. UIC 10036 TaxID=2304196 RepID=UPI0012DA6559|nr:hypothetical protein [Scytonema sp. UIC 10036]MUG96456.1 hypothetical protein [Scytonema sp. UIC 10036]
MAFIKIQNVIINTNYVVAVKLNNQTSIGENSISVLISTPKFSLLSPETVSQDSQDLCRDEWVEFTGQAAIALHDYFTSFNNVIDLMQNYE